MCEELDDAPQALDAFVEALLLEPTDEPTAIALEAIANALGSWESIVRAVDAGLLTAKNDDVRVLALLEHLVRWTKTYLGRVDVAETYLARVRAIDPSHSALHSQRASVYRENGAFDFQREELERALLSARSHEEQRLLRLRLADLAELRF